MYNLREEILFSTWKWKMLTFSHCLRTQNAPKEVANSYRRESRGISKFYWQFSWKKAESVWFSRAQSTASHLFARTRSFHRPTYKRPAGTAGLRVRHADHSATLPPKEWTQCFGLKLKSLDSMQSTSHYLYSRTLRFFTAWGYQLNQITN